MKCPKCKGEMEEGLLGDKIALATTLPQVWGTRMIASGLLGQKNLKSVCTYRCSKCGYLESYAK